MIAVDLTSVFLVSQAALPDLGAGGNADVLDGEKTWITNASIADVFVVRAKTDDDLIRGFVIGKGWKGLSPPASWETSAERRLAVGSPAARARSARRSRPLSS